MMVSFIQKFKLILYCVVALSFKAVKRLSVLQLEMAFRMSLLEKRIMDAVISLQSCWRAISCRRKLLRIIRARRKAILLIQAMVKLRLMKAAKAKK